MTTTSFDPKSYPDTFAWVSKISKKINPRFGGKIVIVGTIDTDTDAYTIDRFIEIHEISRVPQTIFGFTSILGISFGETEVKHHIFSVATEDSDVVMLKSQVPHNGNFPEYPEIQELVKKYSPYFKR